MYGLPAGSDLSFLKGKEICQIAIGSHDVQFHWGAPDGGISVFGRFTYYPAGRPPVVWAGERQHAGEAALTVRLLEQTIVEVRWKPDGELTLEFSNGDRLVIVDDNPRHEAYTIRDGDRPLIVV
jgi:hypothetical protein